MRKRKAYLLSLLSGLLFPLGTVAQTGWVDEHYILDGLPLLGSRNPAGLQVLDLPSLSLVELYGNKSDGKLINYHESDNAFQVFAGARSLYRFNPRTVMRGAISYELDHGRNRSGSVFLDPYYNTFDLLEMTDENKGLKKTERYHVETDLSFQVYKGLTLGAAFDFVSANLSKMKDLRHANTYSDLKLDLGFSYSFKEKLTIGAAWNFRKSVEGISFERFSAGDLHYELLVSYGPFWGKRKTYDENMGQISRTTTPVKNIFQGGSLQLDFNPTSRFELYLEGSCSYRSCEYGHRSPNTILYNTFSGLEYGASIQALFKENTHRHLLLFEMNGRSMNSYESIYKTVHHQDGENETRYHDPKKVSDADLRHYSFRYRGDLQTRKKLPAGTIQAEFTIHERSRLTTLYPYFRQEHLIPFFCQIDGQGNIPVRKNLFSIGLALSYAGHLIDDYTDSSYVPEPTQMKPKSAPQMQNREHEYLTCPKIGLTPSFRYSRQFGKTIAWIELSYTCRKALVPLEYLTGDELHIERLSLGFSF